MTTKPDALAIEKFIRGLAREPWIVGTTRAPWPTHLFRIDDVRAAATILEREALYSRDRAQQLDLLKHDAASPDVIANSPAWLKRCVRLYFRPRTPTEFRSEGFRPQGQLPMGAHRPVPVVFVFESIPLLCSSGTTFTNGNAAAPGVQRGDSAAFLRSIPFELVYHEGAIKDSQKKEVVFRRCAEVLVPDELDLTHLRRVLCRSQAEYETLLDLLSASTRRKYAKMIGVSTRVHCMKWTFVESVELTAERVRFQFSTVTETPGPFDALAEVSDGSGRVVGRWHRDAFMANGVQGINLRTLPNLGAYRVTLKLDGLLAYSGVFKPAEALL